MGFYGKIQKRIGVKKFPYIGQDDDTLDLMGATSLTCTPPKGGRSFKFTLANLNNINDLYISLTPTYLETAAAIQNITGHTCDAVISDGTIIAGVVCTASEPKLTIENLKRFTLYNPTRLSAISISSTFSDGALAKELVWFKISPFKEAVMKKLSLNKYITPCQYNDKKIAINFSKLGINLQFDPETVIILKVGKRIPSLGEGELLKITLDFDVTFNRNLFLRRKAIQARAALDEVQNIPGLGCICPGSFL